MRIELEEKERLERLLDKKKDKEEDFKVLVPKLIEEFYRMLQGVVIDNSGLFNEQLREWENFYNFQRSGAYFGSQTPFDRLKEKLREVLLTKNALSYP